jgi:pimeloyl-ACP methyl ester carboxylesterase
MEDPLFADHYNLVAFDMRGHGLTTVDGGPDDQYDAWTAAQDLAAGLVSTSRKTHVHPHEPLG